MWGSGSGQLSALVMRVEKAIFKRIQETLKIARETVLDAEFTLKLREGATEKLTQLADVDLFKLIKQARFVLSKPASAKPSEQELKERSIKWNLISAIQPAAQLCAVLEGSAKETKNSLFTQMKWHDEMADMLAFRDLEQRCSRFICNDLFWMAPETFVKMGVIAKSQLECLHQPFKKDVSQDEIAVFRDNNETIIDKLSDYRDSLLCYSNASTKPFQ